VNRAQEVRGVNIKMSEVETACVSGTVVSTPSRASYELSVSRAYPTSQSRIAFGSIHSGDFRICGVPQGAYRLVIMRSGAGAQVFEARTFTVGQEDIELAPLQPHGLQKITAVISLNAPNEMSQPNAEVEVQLVRRFGLGVQGETTAITCRIPGVCEFGAVGDDEYYLEVTSRSPNFYLRSVRVAGDDVTYRPFRVSALSTLGVTVGSDAPTLVGRVVGRDGRRVPGAVVNMVSSVPPLPGAQAEVVTRRADGAGHVVFTGFKPGEYKLVAMHNEIVNGAGNPSSFDVLPAKNVMLESSSQQVVELVAADEGVQALP
jgi:hypothetical protein